MELKTLKSKAGALMLGTALALALAGCSRNTEEQEKTAAAHAAAERAEFAAQRAEKAAKSAEKLNAPVVVEGDPEATEDAADADKAEAESEDEADGPASTEPTTKT